MQQEIDRLKELKNNHRKNWYVFNSLLFVYT